MKHRVRTCKTCGKQLGGTLVECHECGGEKPSPTREERLRDAVEWKLRLGVTPSSIEAAHGYTING